MARIARWLAAALVAAGCMHPQSEVPYVQTPDDVAIQMLRLADVRAEDTVWDLGSGDGRIVLLAARQFGARGVGVEIEPRLVTESRDSARNCGTARNRASALRHKGAVPLAGEAAVACGQYGA